MNKQKGFADMGVKFDRLVYGGDYNPDQWLEYPDILEEDIRLMKKAHVNTVSLGIFAWAKLEPQEGVYDFDWMEEIINRLYENGISVFLATPSGARPALACRPLSGSVTCKENAFREIFLDSVHQSLLYISDLPSKSTPDQYETGRAF